VALFCAFDTDARLGGAMRRQISRSLFGVCVLVGAGCKGDDVASGGVTDTSSAAETTATTTTTTSVDTTTAGTTTEASATATTTSADTEASADSTGETGALDCPYTPNEQEQPAVHLERVAGGFNRPLLVVGHPTEPERLFVVEQHGTIRLLEPGMTEAPTETFLDLAVATGQNEQGLLGFTLHPGFPDDPRVYVAYNPPGGVTSPVRIAEYEVGADGSADPESARTILDVAQPNWNHQGGMIAFGPDGYLYIGTGDGGGGGDPYGTGRAPNHILAKILRIGIEPDGNPNHPTACDTCAQPGPFDYTIPPDNPFVDDPSFAPEVWAWGLRNPWRFSFDPETGDLYASDVGQNAREEVDLIVPGADYGWSQMEGFACYSGACDVKGPNEVNDDGQTMPLVDYSIAGSRCAIIGLGVYRSCEVPAFDGLYFYGDFCTGDVFALGWDGHRVDDRGSVWQPDEGLDMIRGGGTNAHGDVFVAATKVPFLGGPIEDGIVYRITAGR
jgi:glucose/arabinose dehydrogenase